MSKTLSALVLGCSLKRSTEPSSSELLGREVLAALADHDVTGEIVRVVDHNVKFGVSTDEGDGDAWPAIRRKLLAAQILVIATPIWMGQPSSVCKMVLERLDAELSETDDEGRLLTYGKVAVVAVVGNEDGAHHVISEVAGALGDIGFTVPGQAWTYWNKGPGPGPSYADTDEGHDWSQKTGRAMAANLVAVATALTKHPLPAPPS